MIFEHYIIILLWILGGEATLNHVRSHKDYQGGLNWDKDIALTIVFVLWPFIALMGFIRRLLF